MSSKEHMTTTGEKKIEHPSEPHGGASSWYEVLDLQPAATAAEIQKGHQHALDLVEGRTIGGYFLLDPVAVASAKADIEAAFYVLGDAGRRAAYDAKIGNAATLIPTDAAPTQPPIAAVEDTPDEITASDARRMLGMNSTPSGEGVFAPLSPEAKAAVAAAASPATPAADPTSSPPGAAKRAPGEDQKRAPSVKFLKPVVAEAQAQKETSSPGRRVGGITFAPPKTDGQMVIPSPEELKKLAAMPTPTPTPPTTTAPPEQFAKMAAAAQEAAKTLPETQLVPTMTVLPTATMPAPAPSSSSSTSDLPTNLPVAMTPMPQPGLFSLEGTEVNGQLLKRLREARGLSLEGMVEATKIRKPYLLAIEEQDLENLPARVYLRGFLTQIARVLRVDKVKLAEGYLAFVAKYGK